MADYAGLLQDIAELHKTVHPSDVEQAPEGFPLRNAYAGQVHAVEALLHCNANAVLSSHTGSGKTAVFLSLTNRATLIIEPRKFLQKQVASYRNDFVIFGRSEYPCHYADNAAVAPCIQKVICSIKNYRDLCEHISDDCKKHPCKVFRMNKQWVRYPCAECEYIKAVQHAMELIKNNGTIISNFGNFWQFVKHAQLIIIDEADLFFKEVSSPLPMRYGADVDFDIKKMLHTEIDKLDEEMKTCMQTRYYQIQNIMYKIEFLLKNIDICFAYRKRDKRTDNDKYYVEINPESTPLLKERLFPDKDVLIVTATPAEFNLPAVTYSIWQRCGIYYVPQGKLTSRSLKQQPFLLENAAQFIKMQSSIFGGLYGSKKFVVHCGNIGNHATRLFAILNTMHREPGDSSVKSVCTLHEAGNLMRTIENFQQNDMRYLLVASAEYGADFSWCNCQFVLKVPYAGYDDRLKALEKKIGNEKFKRWYTLDAINRLIQQCGRVGRGWNSFGCTFILDSKFSEVYKQYSHVFPEWFKQRLRIESY